MKQTKIYLLIFSFLVIANASMSQMKNGMHNQCTFEVGAGIASYNGDLTEGNKVFSQSSYSLSVGVSYKFKPKWTFHTDFSLLKVGAADKNNSKAVLRNRNLSFKSSIEDLNGGFEYDILDIQKTKITPYLYGGIGLFYFDPYAVDRLGYKRYLRNLGTEGQGYSNTKPFYLRTQFELPFGGGIKWSVNRSVSVKFDFRIRKTFTDYIDDVSTTYPDIRTFSQKGTTIVNLSYRGDELTPSSYPSGAQRGNPNTKDFYYTGEVKVCFKLKK